MTPGADNFERVNAGSGVIVFHHQTRMSVIGNWVNICHPEVIYMIDGVRTLVRFEKRPENLWLHHPLPHMGAPPPRSCRLLGREGWDCLCERCGTHPGR